MYSALFISPHIDDAVFSCGGLLARTCRDGRALVVSVFSNSGRSTATRKREEERAAGLVGFDFRFLDLPDNRRRDWIGWLPPRMFRPFDRRRDQAVLDEAAAELAKLFRETAFEKLYLPLGVGRHIDHEICLRAGLREGRNHPVFFYEDLPHALKRGALERRLNQFNGSWENPGLPARPVPLSVPLEELFDLKIDAVWSYESEARRFFKGKEEALRVLRSYHTQTVGLCERLWIAPVECLRSGQSTGVGSRP